MREARLLVLLPLLFFCFEPTFSHVMAANTAQVAIAADNATSAVPSFVSSYAWNIENRIVGWGTRYAGMVGQCFMSDGLSKVERDFFQGKLERAFVPSSENGKALLKSVKDVLERIPLVRFAVSQFKDRPDLAVYLLQGVEQTNIGHMILSRYFSWLGEPQRGVGPSPRLGEQALVQTKGADMSAFGALIALYVAMDPENAINFSKNLVNDHLKDGSEMGTEIGLNSQEASQGLSGGSSNALKASFEPGDGPALLEIQSTTNALLQGNPSQELSGPTGSSGGESTKDSGPDSFATSSPGDVFPQANSLGEGGPSTSAYESVGAQGGGGETGSLSSLSSSSFAQSSLGGSSGAGLSSQGAEGDNGGANAGGGGGGGSSSDSSGGAKHGCCGALMVIIFLLGMGCAAEYYAANMHKYEQDKYELYLKKNIEENVKQLQEYLLQNGNKLELLKERMNDDEDELNADKDVNEGGIKVDSGVNVDILLKLPLDYKKITENLVAHADGPTTNKDEKDKAGDKAKKDAQTKGVDAKSAESTAKDQGADHAEKVRKMQDAIKQIVPKMLGVFYAGYSAMPSPVNKQFGFYLTLLVLAVVLSSAM